jgi:hypothetical protein
MATPPTTISLPSQDIARLVEATRVTACATLTAAMIGKTKRTLSIGDAMKIFNDVQFSMFPDPGNSIYDAWRKSFVPDQIV